jgi:hypothetical protein
MRVEMTNGNRHLSIHRCRREGAAELPVGSGGLSGRAAGLSVYLGQGLLDVEWVRGGEDKEFI